MSTEPLDELYLKWLYNQVADEKVRDPSLSYWKLFRQLYTTEFVWQIPNDDNRLEDGKDLRLEFIHEQGIESAETEWVELGCSVLELMLGLARRLAFEADGQPYYWFWKLVENIGLMRYNDRRRYPRQRIEDIIETVIFRQYEPDGSGGFFPLRNPGEDQRQVELWYQLSAYVLELLS